MLSERLRRRVSLIEVCFVDSDDAEHYLSVGADKIAKAIAAALLPIAAPE